MQRLGSVKSHLRSDLSLRLAHEPVRPLGQFASGRLFDAEVAIPVAAHLFGDILWTCVGTRTGKDVMMLDSGWAALHPTSKTLTLTQNFLGGFLQDVLFYFIKNQNANSCLH